MVKEVALYGGAIRTVLPEGFLDASVLREVPDTQEIFVNSRQKDEVHSDGLGLNESIIVDLLERVPEKDNYKALQEHLEEITDWNGGRNASLAAHDTMDIERQCCMLTESIEKWGKRDERQTVVLCVGLIRMAEFSTDVIITINVPVEPEMRSELDVLATGQLPDRAVAAYDLLKTIVHEFKVLDSSLFI